MIITSQQKRQLISKLTTQTESGELKWERIGHHQPSPTSIQQFIYGLTSEYVLEDSYWSPYKEGFFCLLHTVYDPSSLKDEQITKKFNDIFDLNLLSHGFIPVPANATEYKTNYKLLVQADQYIVPELIPPAGEPMFDELYVLSEVIKRANAKNEYFITQYLQES